jgi:hypothetical protein
MPEALSSIGTFLGSGAGKGLLTAGTAGGGLLQNLLAERQTASKQKFVQDLITNPEKFNALVARTEKPLSQGLTTDIARQTDAYGAERGLGSSPAIMREVYAQALAPYQQQQQQIAINSLLNRLGIYAQQPTMKPVDVSSIFKALQGGGSAPDVTSGIDLGSMPPLPFPTDILPGPASLPTPTVDFEGAL